MSFLHLVRDKTSLEGTVFIELLPGRYKGTCWNSGSVYLDEETFGLFEGVIELEVPEYSRYAFTDVTRAKWLRIAARIHAFASELRAAKSWQALPKDIRFIFLGTEARFAEDLPTNAQELANTATELASWVEHVLQEHEAIAILGI